MKQIFKLKILTAILLVAISASVLITGCAPAKRLEKVQSETMRWSDTTVSVDSSETTVEENMTTTNSDIKLWQRTYAVDIVPVAESTVKLNVPIKTLNELPECAGYSAKEGQAGVEVRRHGDNLTVIGRCDSIERLCRIYREIGLNALTVNDSLTRELSKTKRTCAKQSEELQQLRLLSEKTDKSPEHLKWLLYGFIPGLIIGYQIKRIKNILTKKK